MVRRSGVYIVGVVVILFVGWFLVNFVPRQWRQVADIMGKSRVESAEVTKLSAALTVLQTIDRKKLASQLAIVNAALPSQKKTSGLVSGISNVAGASGVSLVQVNFSPGKISTDSGQEQETVADQALPGTAVRQVGAAVTVGTDLASLLTFISKIQAASQLIGVSKVSFSGSSARQQVAAISLLVYFEPAPQEAVDWGKVRSVSTAEEKVVTSLSSQDVFILPEERR